MPKKIDRHVQVPAPRDAQGRESCPDCRTCLSDVQQHEPIVEDVIARMPKEKVKPMFGPAKGRGPRA